MTTITSAIDSYIINLQKLPSPILQDEDEERYVEFRQDLLVELAPTSRYLVRVACSLVEIEWELDRHRRLRAAAVTTATRIGLTRQLEQIERNLSTADRMPARHKEAIIEGAVSDNPERREKAAAAIAARGYSISEFTAAAFDAPNASVLYHDAKIGNLENRRRQVRAEYDALKSRTSPADIVIDGEVVTE